MGKFGLIKKLFFIVVVVITAVYLYNYGRQSSRDVPEAQKMDDIVKTQEIPGVSEGVKKDIKISGIGEEQQILSFDMTGYSKDGSKKWEISGQSADVLSDIIILNEIKANAYSEGREVLLEAKGGKYNKKENSIVLENNVVITTSDGVNLSAEWFEWNSESGKITTDSFVEVKKDNLYASGHGASAGTEKKEVQLNKDIFVKQDKITITCGGPLIIEYGKNKASFYDSVKVTEPRGKLYADRLDVFFDIDTQKIDKVVAEGNIELKQNQDVAKGQKIVYTMASGEAVLTGNPEIVIHSSKGLEDAFITE